MTTRQLWGSVSIAALTAISSPSWAQDASVPAAPPATTTAEDAHSNVLEEIVVTGARRRTEDVQSVPVAVTAINSALLERNNINSTADLSHMAPNLVIVRQLATPAQASIYLRGFGSESNSPAIDPPIAITVDGVYQPQASGNLIDLFDLESVEIQRGPQGTLQGKNAPTGAISFVSKRPTGKLDFTGEVGYERFDHKSIKGRMDIPLIPDVLALKLTGVYKDGGNFIRALQDGGKRKFGGESVLAGKFGLLFTPSSNFEWLVNGFIERGRNPQTGMRDLAYLGANGPFQGTGLTCTVFGHCAPTKRFTSNGGWTKGQKANTKQVASQMTLHLEPVTLTAITGYKKYSELNNTDVDAEPEPLLDALGDPLNYTQFSQEVRVSSAKNGGLDLDGKLDWVLGAYYSKYKYSNQQNLDIFGNVLTSDEHGTTTSKAVFAHLIYNFTEKFNITFGARESWDRKTHDYVGVGETTHFFDDPIKFKNFSFEAGAQYKISHDKQVYFRFAEGYRAGGFQGLPAPGGTQDPYQPETVKTYEIGFKGDFLDRRLRTNATVFMSDYSKLQRTVIGSLPFAPFYTQIIKNAANAKVKGVELEMTAVPTTSLTISGSITYLDAKYKNYIASFIPGTPPTDNDNFPFPYSSKWTFKVGPQYVVDVGDAGTLTLSTDATHTSRYFVAGIPYPAARVRPLWDVSARAKFETADGRYTVSIYGENLTNNHFIENFTTPPGGNALYFAGADHKPITYGVIFGLKL